MMCVRRVHIAICVSPMVLISSALFPWYQLRAILILISYIDTCALPVVECNKRIVSGRLYCADRECSIAQAQDDDNFLTVIFSDACQVFTEKNICDNIFGGQRCQVVWVVSFPVSLVVCAKPLTIMSSAQISAQLR